MEADRHRRERPLTFAAPAAGRRHEVKPRRVLLIFVLAVALNYAWELAQAPLYVGVHFPAALWHCFRAALGDGVMVLLVFGIAAAMAGSPDWHRRRTPKDSLVMAAAGLSIALVVEWWGLHIAQRWQYSELMPVVPWTGVGAVPLAQMLVLPPAVFALARRLEERSHQV